MGKECVYGGTRGQVPSMRAAHSRALGDSLARRSRRLVAQVREGQAGAALRGLQLAPSLSGRRRPPACLRPWPVSPRSVPGPGPGS